MKNTKICPKCSSSDIVRIVGKTGYRDTANVVSSGLLFTASVSRYVCCGCGFSEEWIENEKDLEKLKKKYSKENGYQEI